MHTAGGFESKGSFGIHRQRFEVSPGCLNQWPYKFERIMKTCHLVTYCPIPTNLAGGVADDKKIRANDSGDGLDDDDNWTREAAPNADNRPRRLVMQAPISPIASAHDPNCSQMGGTQWITARKVRTVYTRIRTNI